MYVFLLCASLIAYGIASSILGNFLARIFGYKEGGTFAISAILVLMCLIIIFISFNDNTESFFGILLVSVLFILFVMGLDNERKTFD